MQGKTHRQHALGHAYSPVANWSLYECHPQDGLPNESQLRLHSASLTSLTMRAPCTGGLDHRAPAGMESSAGT